MRGLHNLNEPGKLLNCVLDQNVNAKRWKGSFISYTHSEATAASMSWKKKKWRQNNNWSCDGALWSFDCIQPFCAFKCTADGKVDQLFFYFFVFIAVRGLLFIVVAKWNAVELYSTEVWYEYSAQCVIKSRKRRCDMFDWKIVAACNRRTFISF